MINKICSIFFCILCSFESFSQQISDEYFGFKLGVNLNLGTHSKGIGILFSGFHTNHFYQINLGSNFTFFLNSYGKRKLFWEARNSLGVVLLAGEKRAFSDFQFDGLIHNTQYNYGVAYNYLWYFDNRQTSQVSGGWGLHLKNVSLFIENDIFGGKGLDKFRTAAFEIAYKQQDYKLHTNLYLWTGQTRGAINHKEITTKKMPNGYRDISHLPYGKTSHGILSFGITGMIPNIYSDVSAKIGIDSEQIRHLFQNRLFHDLIFMPKSYPRTTLHYPRLDENGNPSLLKSEKRKDKLFFQASMNEVWSR